MSTYLSRPIFEFTINWAEGVKREFNYDIREFQLGRVVCMQPLQQSVVHGWEFDLLLSNESEIEEFEAFIETCNGRINGFWLPSPMAACAISDGVDASSFLIEDQGLRELFSGSSCHHWIFSKPGETTQYAEVDTVTSNNDGANENVTLKSALSTAVDETWNAFLMFYVRFATDDHSAEFIADNIQKRSVRVVELPAEYAATETGQAPVWLYDFWIEADTNVHWRFTSLNQNVTAGGYAFSSAAIQHNGHIASLKQESGLTIESAYESSNPLSRFMPPSLPRPLWVKAYETTYSAPSLSTPIFCGVIDSVSLKGTQITAKAVSLTGAIGRRFPRFLIQPRCNYVFLSDLCGADLAASGLITNVNGFIYTIGSLSMPGGLYKPANFFKGGTITQNTVTRSITASTVISADTIQITTNASIGGNVGDPVTFTPAFVAVGTLAEKGIRTMKIGALSCPGASKVANDYSFGWFETGTGETLEVRTIDRNTAISGGYMYVELSAPLRLATEGAEVRMYPGCDGTRQTCKTKHGNFRRWGGHVMAPRNLSVKAMDSEVVNGNKK
jgi:hypothetical protein